MNTKIQNRPVNHTAFEHLTANGVSTLMARLYAARNIESIDETNTSFQHLLHFEKLHNCTQAAQELADAILQKKNICIVADYDADGATACTVGMKGLASMGAKVDFLVPNRFEHGYGLSPTLVDLAHEAGAQVLITVDNGIASIAGVAHANALGMHVIVTDHHLPADTLPDCTIVNPNQQACSFPSKALAGVGVIFYVLMALRSHLRSLNYFNTQQPEPNLGELLDLVALGTVADVVPLDHNNRILVANGLKRVRAGKMSAGVKALFGIAKRDSNKAQSFDFGFALGPRINAAGRLDDMSLGIQCLLASTDAVATEYAKTLDELNQDRRSIEQSMLKQALNLPEVSLHAQQRTVVVHQADWHQGVVGVVASRLKEKFHRPTIVFAPADNGEWRGSGRSVPNVHLRDILDIVSKRYPDLIIKFGGHAMAAGLSIHEHNMAAFQAAFEEVMAEEITVEGLAHTFVTDGQLESHELTIKQAQTLAEPIWGQGFAQPSFQDTFKVAWQKLVGVNHKKVGLFKNGQIFEAMIFRCTDDLPEDIHVVYRPVINEWRNNVELQLYIDFWQAA